MSEKANTLRSQILALVREYHNAAFAEQDFIPNECDVPVGGRVFDADEIMHLVDSSLDFWLTAGRYAQEFEKRFAQEIFGIRYAMLVNSGSSANLVALSALTSPSLGERALKPGDEVITVAAGFPTTVNPILQNRLVPVFVDVDIPTYNIDVTQLEAALSERTRAIMIAHTLGNPFNLEAVMQFVKRYNLWLVEDCCDAVGTTYNGRHVGRFGHLATASFYPPHHITMGEGGAVMTQKPALKKLVESFRDWGRDCWCKPGKDNTCGKRFGWQLGDLPCGYDHKYIYSHIGYNLKLTDMQAAVGVAQLAKLSDFIVARKRNFKTLYEGLKTCADVYILPEATPHGDPSWFGFPIAIRRESGLDRSALIRHLNAHKIATRQLFGGNLLRQPAYQDIPHRTIGNLENTNFVMDQVFWVGVYPGLTDPMLNHMIDVLTSYNP